MKKWLAELLFIVTLMCSGQGIKQMDIHEYPKPLGIPKKFVTIRDETDLKKGGARDISFWVVFSDRSYNPTYLNPDCQEESGIFLDFLDAFYICDETNLSVALVKNDIKKETGEFNKKAQFYGWIPKSKLILSPSALKNDKGISRKGLIINRIDNQQNVLDPQYILSLGLKTAPNLEAENFQQSNVFAIYPLIKTNINDNPENKNDYWYLLASESGLLTRGETLQEIEEYNKRIVLGWLPQSSITNWDTRIALEPNWDQSAIKQRLDSNWPAVIFNGLKSLNEMNSLNCEDRLRYINSSEYTHTKIDPFADINLNQVNIEEILENHRPEGKIFRLPRLELLDKYYKIDDDIAQYKIGFIGDVTTRVLQDNTYILGRDVSAEMEAELRDKLIRMKENLTKVNVVFVVDATNSMEDYLRAVRNSISEIMNSLTQNSKNNFKFAGVIYRDKGDDTPSPLPLTTKVNNITEYFNIEATSVQKPYPELMYQGIIDGITKTRLAKDQFNLLVLIGDCGNHRVTNYNKIETDIADYLNNYNCNFIAYQVAYHNSVSGKQASQDFQDQTTRIAIKSYNNNQVNKSLGKQQIKHLNKSKISYYTPDGILNSTIFPWNNNIRRDDNDLMTSIINRFNNYQQINQKTIYYIEDLLRGGVNQDELSILKDDISGDRDISILAKAYFLKDIEEEGERARRLASLVDKGIERFQLYIPGYVQNRFYKDNGKISEPLFKEVIFISHSELTELLDKFNSATKISINLGATKNIIVANVWIEFIETIIGGFSESEKSKYATFNNVTIGELVEISFGARSTSKFSGFSIQDILDKDPNDPVDNLFLDELLGHIQQKSTKLRKEVAHNRDYKYQLRLDDKMPVYYWIPVDMLP